MIRFLKRRLAIRNYVWKLSQELSRRFNKKQYYSIEEITKAAQGAGLRTAFLSYAHAIFCSREEFDAYYSQLRLCSTYDGLRATVSRRYFDGMRDFDAADIINATKHTEGRFYESGIGMDGG